jgi:hypothetical protein
MRKESYQGFMELTKSFISSANMPLFSSKNDLYHIFSILSVFSFIHIYSSLLDAYMNWKDEKISSILIDLFATDFIMIHKPFCLEKD